MSLIVATNVFFFVVFMLVETAIFRKSVTWGSLILFAATGGLLATFGLKHSWDFVQDVVHYPFQHLWQTACVIAIYLSCGCLNSMYEWYKFNISVLKQRKEFISSFIEKKLNNSSFNLTEEFYSDWYEPSKIQNFVRNLVKDDQPSNVFIYPEKDKKTFMDSLLADAKNEVAAYESSNKVTDARTIWTLAAIHYSHYNYDDYRQVYGRPWLSRSKAMIATWFFASPLLIAESLIHDPCRWAFNLCYAYMQEKLISIQNKVWNS